MFRGVSSHWTRLLIQQGLGAVVLDRNDLDVGFAEDHEQVALAGVLEVAGCVQVGIHACLEDRDATELAEFGGVRLVAERAGDEHVEVGVGGFASGGYQVGTGDGAELGGDEDAGAALGAGVRMTFDVAALGAEEVTGPRGERGEGDAVLLVGLLDAGRVQMFQDYGREVLMPVVAGLGLGKMVGQFVILVDAGRAMRRQALHRERAGDADDAPILVGLVVQVLEVRLAAARSPRSVVYPFGIEGSQHRQNVEAAGWLLRVSETGLRQRFACSKPLSAHGGNSIDPVRNPFQQASNPQVLQDVAVIRECLVGDSCGDRHTLIDRLSFGFFTVRECLKGQPSLFNRTWFRRAWD